MEPPRENNSPSTPSRYLNSYLQQNSTELFHGIPQNFPTQRGGQLAATAGNQQFYGADNLSTTTTTSSNNKNYLKRHHQHYHNEKSTGSSSGDGERDKKYDKYDNSDAYSNDTYATTNLNQSTGSASSQVTPAAKTSAVAGTGAAGTGPKGLSNGKKTKGRVKIKMEYIDNKLRRYTTFSKRKTGIMKKAYELSTLTGTQVMLLVASETGHVYTFATRKLQPMITSEAGKTLIQTCLNSPDIPTIPSADQRMSATGFEETELNYSISDIGDNPGDKEKLSFQDDITSTDESCDESSNDENCLQVQQKMSSQAQLHHQHHHQQQQQSSMANIPSLRSLDEENRQHLVIHNQKLSEKILDNQKLLLDSLSSLPPNLLQSWIHSGQLQVTVDEDGMQSIQVPFAIQKENSTQEIITKKIPIKLLAGKIKSEGE